MLTRASLSNIEVNVFSDAGNGRAWNLHRLPCVIKRKRRRVKSSLHLDQKFHLDLDYFLHHRHQQLPLLQVLLMYNFSFEKFRLL